MPRLPPHAESAIDAFLRAHVGGGRVGRGRRRAQRRDRFAPWPRGWRGTPSGRTMFSGSCFRTPPTRERSRRRREGTPTGSGSTHRTIPIEPADAALRAMLPEVHDRTTAGNTKARIRMIVLYTIARETHRLVVGTGNKSELLLGYFTKYGDGGVGPPSPR